MSQTTGETPVAASLAPGRRPVGRFVTLTVAVLLLGAGAYIFMSRSAGKETTDNAQVEGHIHAISPAISGGVTKSFVENNQFVERGAPLFELDQESFRANLEKAKADLAEAEATNGEDSAEVPVTSTATASRLAGAQAALGEVRATVAAARRQIDAARARKASVLPLVKAAQADSDRAAADLARMKTLMARDEVSRQQYDGAFAAAESAKAHLEAAQAKVAETDQDVAVTESQLAREESRLPRAQSDIEAAQSGPQEVASTRARAAASAARIAAKRAALGAAQLDMERTVVHAPVSGIIGQKNFEVGQILIAGQPVVAIVSVDELWVVANYKESQLAQIRPGQKADIEVDALGGQHFQGTVDSLAGATGSRFSLLPPENASGNYVKVVQRIPVKIKLNKGQQDLPRLRPGMSVFSAVTVDVKADTAAGK